MEKNAEDTIIKCKIFIIKSTPVSFPSNIGLGAMKKSVLKP